jgi:SAM-dependent methyltransferase
MRKLVSLLIRYIPRKYLQRISGPGLKIAGFFLRGSAVTCPVCSTSFRRFLPYGRIQPRQNALCPQCLSLERHRLLWLYLKEKTPFFNQSQAVLHVAPEACFIRRFEKIHGNGYVTADIESPLAKVKMDIHRIPFENDTFDVVLCNHVLEHVGDDIQAMREIARVLKPGGFAILQVPFFHPIADKTISDPSVTSPKQREKMFGQDDHVRKYGRDYSIRIQRAGMRAVEEDFVNSLPEEQRRTFGLVKGEIIFRGEKVEEKSEGREPS